MGTVKIVKILLFSAWAFRIIIGPTELKSWPLEHTTVATMYMCVLHVCNYVIMYEAYNCDQS